MKKQKTLFATAEFPIIKHAKNSETKLTFVSENVVVLTIDEKEIIIKKDEQGYMRVHCPCEFCGSRGIANNILCRRQIRALWFMIRMNGKVNEIEKGKLFNA
jgi:hypothetical protein